jgi:CRP-like cAMP-binding protein
MDTARAISPATVIRILKKIPLFFGMLDREYEQMVSVFHLVQFPQGACIFREGDKGQEMFVLLAGEVEIISEKVGRLHVAQPGEIFGEIALVTPLNRTATVVVRDEATVMRIGRDDIETLLGKAPRISYLIMKHIAEALAERLAAANHRLSSS